MINSRQPGGKMGNSYPVVSFSHFYSFTILSFHFVFLGKSLHLRAPDDKQAGGEVADSYPEVGS